MGRNYNYYVYIMASTSLVIYIGVTNDLLRRVAQHKSELIEGFSKKYKTKKLVYYEHYTDINYAIQREKELKSWRRSKKLELIAGLNPKWQDLYVEMSQSYNGEIPPPAARGSG